MPTLRRSGLSIIVLALITATPAASDGGGGGGGGSDGGSPSMQGISGISSRPQQRIGVANGNRVNRMQNRPSAETTLPDGTVIRSTGVGGGVRAVRTTTPDGTSRVGARPRGAQPAGRGQSRTTYNPQTGITSTWTRNADGTVTGVHVDRQGNRSVSNSRPRG